MFSISFIGIIIASFVYFIIGFLAHGPLLGKLWMKLADIHPTGNEKFSDMYGKMFWNIISNIGTATMLSIIIVFMHTTLSISPYIQGIISAGIVWIIIVSGSAMEVIWMERKISLWLFEIMCSLVCLISMSFVLVVFL